MKHLIIVESPSKAKTIKNFLDGSYQVVASKGHIRDLPKRKMGIAVKEGRFEPDYEVDKDHAALVKEIQALAKKAQHVYIATDEDREGEAIGYHIAVLLGNQLESYPRIVFHEVTKKAILEALEHPRTIDMKKVNAQQARRLLDRLVGYNLSPLLASKIQKGLSAGRVQSSALKIVVDREREIRAFIPQEYWRVSGLFSGNLEAELYSYQGEKIDKLSVGNAERAAAIRAGLEKAAYKIGTIETKERRTTPQPPFMTSTLQQTASGKLGFSPKKTMMLAQKLYEGVPTDKGESGVITYMRTDSLYITPEANAAARAAIVAEYGKKYLVDEVRVFKTKNKGAQEAHEAIRPTDIEFTPQKAAKFLGKDELRLYTLIYSRFLASQMSDAVFETQNIFIEGGEGVFKASGRKLVFDGFYRVMGDDDKDKLLPALKTGEKTTLEKLETTQHFTEPPARYSEAGLVKALEQLGIGRPSTYAPTLSILESRGYITVEKKQIAPTEVAFTVTEVLEQNFPEIVDSQFTARMEEELDEVAEDQKDWQRLLAEFYEPFIAKIGQGKTGIESRKTVEPIGEACPECGADLVKRKGRFGEFISCSGFPKCKYTRNLGEKPKAEMEVSDEKCDKCGAPMIVREGRTGKFLACSAYPKCKNTRTLEPAEKIDVPCPKCGGEIRKRQSKRGVFYGCTSYPKCDFIAKFAPTATKCPQCGWPMAARTLRGKEIFECVNPECKHKEDA